MTLQKSQVEPFEKQAKSLYRLWVNESVDLSLADIYTGKLKGWELEILDAMGKKINRLVERNRVLSEKIEILEDHMESEL